MKPVTYEQMKTALGCALDDMEVLAGDRVGPSGSSWQDVAATAAVHFRDMAILLARASTGDHEACIVFPSPVELLEEAV